MKTPFSMSSAIIYCFVLLTLLAVFGSVSIGNAGTVTLAWDANIEPDLADYTIYYGTKPGNYTESYVLSEHPEMWAPGCIEPYDPFKSVCCQWTSPDLAAGTYYFVATAKDADKNESAYSEELTHVFSTIVRILEQPEKFEKVPDIQ